SLPIPFGDTHPIPVITTRLSISLYLIRLFRTRRGRNYAAVFRGPADDVEVSKGRPRYLADAPFRGPLVGVIRSDHADGERPVLGEYDAGIGAHGLQRTRLVGDLDIGRQALPEEIVAFHSGKQLDQVLSEWFVQGLAGMDEPQQFHHLTGSGDVFV